MSTIWIVPIEPIQQRYTAQWFEQMPHVLAVEGSRLKSSWKIRTIAGTEVPDATTSGAFLDFSATNYYKGTQAASIAQLFQNGEIKPGDKFLVTDTWNFVITAIKYMSELNNVPVEIHGIWHAGAYDPSDILGMKMGKEWSSNQERAWFHACDVNYYATDFHKDMFLKNLKIPKKFHQKAVRSGQLHIQAAEAGDACFSYDKKENMVIFPHRLNEDKQPEIFRDLVMYLPNEWTYVITQDHNFSKEEYYQVFAQSKMVFSCALHENLGIGMMEGLVCGNIPVAPTRASYQEMYDDMFKYPSEWTENWNKYIEHRDELVAFMVNLMDSYDDIHDNELLSQAKTVAVDYMFPTEMIKKLLTPMKIK